MSVPKLFTDASVNPQSCIGYGAYLLLDEDSLDLENSVKTKMFEKTSSTKLELQTLLWALSEIASSSKIMIYTDCQNILGLRSRREKFEKNNYLTAKGRPIANHELYKDFYKAIDSLDCNFVKVKGHKLSHTKDEIDRLFTLVDKASRKALREGRS